MSEYERVPYIPDTPRKQAARRKCRCHICGMFRSKVAPCKAKDDHNMESYEQRMIDKSEADQDQRYWEMVEQAGGEDAIQERERDAYHLSKYGEC